MCGWRRRFFASPVTCSSTRRGKASPPIRSDGYSYYVYLPSWFLYGDSTLDAVARDCCGGEFPSFTAIIRWPDTERWVNAHPIGVAILQTPFFLIGHALTKWSNLSPDGFTLYYQHAAGISGTFWTIAGLFVLRLVLLRHFSDGVTAATLGALLFGTGLYHYATFDSSYSHAYSFFLLAALLWLTERWHDDEPRDTRRCRARCRRSCSVLVGGPDRPDAAHERALFLLVFPLYGVTRGAGLRAAIRRLAARWRELAIVARRRRGGSSRRNSRIYHEATGRILVSSYGSSGLHVPRRRISGACSSACRRGCSSGRRCCSRRSPASWWATDRKLPFLAGTAVVLVVDTYLIASWWDWQFGASYGHRGFVDILPLLAFGLAAFFEWSATSVARRTARCRAGICCRRTVGVPDAAVLERRAANGRHDVGPISRDLPAASLMSCC